MCDIFVIPPLTFLLLSLTESDCFSDSGEIGWSFLLLSTSCVDNPFSLPSKALALTFSFVDVTCAVALFGDELLLLLAGSVYVPWRTFACCGCFAFCSHRCVLLLDCPFAIRLRYRLCYNGFWYPYFKCIGCTAAVLVGVMLHIQVRPLPALISDYGTGRLPGILLQACYNRFLLLVMGE